ncbi:MAG: rod shape-determining protein RodA [Bacillota bacterium]|nr:rod shape-determining protein RodA [Bacillota bacterium]
MTFLKNLKINDKLIKDLDFTLIITIILIVIFGILNIYSTTYKQSGIKTAKIQSIWLILGLVVMYFILTIDYKVLSNYVKAFYWTWIVIITCNDFLGRAVKGAKAMVQLGERTFAPAEFVKLALIFMLAKKIDEMEEGVNNPKNLLILAVYSIIPIVLILAQPALGMAIVSFALTVGILYISKIRLKIFGWGILAIVIFTFIAWSANIIPAYQRNRVMGLLNPDSGTQGINMQVTYSKIAIGSGGLLGKGYLKGSMNTSVPEHQTDFIFCTVGEEWGLAGSAFLLLLYGIVIWRIIYIAKNSKDQFGCLICVGIVSAFLFSILQNIGMTIGFMPVSGIALPFMSYGGSSMLTYFMGMGFVLNVGMRRRLINF